MRRDIPDPVHQMRVAARRMRSALQAFGRVIDRDQTRVLTAELKWAAGELRGARDAEVMAQRFATLLAEVPDELAALDSGRYLALHETRKAAKRLRYALEALGRTQGKPATRLRKRKNTAWLTS